MFRFQSEIYTYERYPEIKRQSQAHLPQVSQWRLVTTPSVAQEDLWRHEATVVQVSRVAAWGLFDAAVTWWHLLAQGADHHRHVGDGRLWLSRLVADIIKVDLLVQRFGWVRQPGHHKVVGYTRAFVFHHLPSPPAGCTDTEGEERLILRYRWV